MYTYNGNEPTQLDMMLAAKQIIYLVECYKIKFAELDPNMEHLFELGKEAEKVSRGKGN